jgi:hypothetical protein
MNNGLPSLLDAIFGKSDLASVSLEEVNEVLREFPSFNAAHFLLSKKLNQENDAAYETVSQRTALYFNNPFWLQSVLNDGNNSIREEYPVSSKPESRHDREAAVYQEVHEEPTPAVVNLDPSILLFQESAPEEIKPETVALRQEETVADKPENAVTSFDELMAKYKIEEPFEESIPETIPAPPAETNHENNTSLQSSTTPATEIMDGSDERFEIREDILNEYGIFEEVIANKTDYDLDVFDRPIERQLQTQESVPVEIQKAETGEVNGRQGENDQAEIQPSIDESIVEHQHTEPLENFDNGDNEAFDGPLDDEKMERVPELETEVDKPLQVFNLKNAESIVFTPYHMVDYFASQGIKLVLEDNPADSFGKQLKSFTDWLKVMKRMPAKTLSDKIDEGEAENIRHFAAHSIEERDILTESMAEVLAKQGMYENAIALYQKLSLIYPPKSAYFASRIEQIKASLP